MMGLAIEIRTECDAAVLGKPARCERDGKMASCLLAIGSVLDGVSRTIAANHADMDRQKLSDWAHRFNAKSAASQCAERRFSAAADGVPRSGDQGARPDWV
jgi:hypothetical protein